MSESKHYNLTVSDNNGRSMVTTNVSTVYPDEIVRLMALAGMDQQQDCGCDTDVQIVDIVDESEYEPTEQKMLDLNDFSSKSPDGPRQPKKIQPSLGDNPLSYSLDENEIYESLMAEFNGTSDQKKSLVNEYTVSDTEIEAFDPDTARLLTLIRHKYPQASSDTEAILKFIQRSTMHGEREDNTQDAELEDLKDRVSKLEKLSK